MPREPKIWGSTTVVRRGMGGGYHSQARVIVKAVTGKRARELLGQSLACGPHAPTPQSFRDYWSVTGNDVELVVATRADEGVWYTPELSGLRKAIDYTRDPGEKLMAKSWEEKFPHPGLGPPRPEPTLDPAVVYPYNDWIRKMRKHNVAKAVDALLLRELEGNGLTPVETIALTLGLMLLDGSSPDRDGSVFGIFGGLLG